MFDQNIGNEQVIREVSLLSWAGKFLNNTEVYSDILTPDEVFKADEERIVKSCWNFMNKCNIIIGHNLVAFDGKLMNTFFLKYGLPPIKYVPVDTLLVAKANFRFSSNSLSFINRQLGIRDKISNDGFILWRRCFEGDPEALETMLEYNIGDIAATEELFYRLRPYVKNINMALYNDKIEAQCPVCGGTDLITTGKVYPTSAGLYEEEHCTTCGTLSRRKQNLLILEKRRSLLINS
jgi:DNA polymerase III epsilon subunit-like protein